MSLFDKKRSTYCYCRQIYLYSLRKCKVRFHIAITARLQVLMHGSCTPVVGHTESTTCRYLPNVCNLFMSVAVRESELLAANI